MTSTPVISRSLYWHRIGDYSSPRAPSASTGYTWTDTLFTRRIFTMRTLRSDLQLYVEDTHLS